MDCNKMDFDLSETLLAGSITSNGLHQTLAEKESEVLSLFISDNPASSFLLTSGEINKQKKSVSQNDVGNDEAFIQNCTAVITDPRDITQNKPIVTEEHIPSISSSVRIISDNETEMVEEAANSVTNSDCFENEHTKIMDDNEKIINIDSDGTATIEFNGADASWITLLNKFEYILNEDRIRGYIEGEKNFICLWERFLASTLSSFSVRSSDRYYRTAAEGEEGAVCGRIIKGSANWSRLPLIPYDGVPFVLLDRKYFGCRYGGPERRNKHKGEHSTQRKGHSMKCGCTAEAEVVEVWRVPELKVPDDVKTCRKLRRTKPTLLAKVKSYILQGRFIRRYYVTLPLINNHQNHPVLDPQAGSVKYVHPKIIEKIYDYVNEEIYEKRIIKFLLEKFVQEYQEEYGVDIQESDRAFHPTDRDLQNHIRNARNARKHLGSSSNSEKTNDSTENSVNNSSKENTYSEEVALNNLHEIATTESSTEVVFVAQEGSHNVLLEGSVAIPTNISNDINSFTAPVESVPYLSQNDVDTVSIDGVVPTDVMEYYATNTVDTNTVTNTNTGSTIDYARKEIKRDSSIDYARKERKFQRKSLKSSKFKRKQIELKALLREEIQKSLSIINVAIQNEEDESKLHIAFKKAKYLQRLVEAKNGNRSLIKIEKRKRTGVQGMVSLLHEKTE